MRLEFDSVQVIGTVFEAQSENKLVTHCQDRRAEYEQYVLQEYLVYRVFNLLTEISFRARLARITYLDSEARRDTITRYALFLEHESAMARRNGWEALRAPAIPPDLVDPGYLSLIGVFQYMIGNPDWSAFSAEPDETECCHNTQPIGGPDGPVFSVPYDFDHHGRGQPPLRGPGVQAAGAAPGDQHGTRSGLPRPLRVGPASTGRFPAVQPAARRDLRALPRAARPGSQDRRPDPVVSGRVLRRHRRSHEGGAGDHGEVPAVLVADASGFSAGAAAVGMTSHCICSLMRLH